MQIPVGLLVLVMSEAADNDDGDDFDDDADDGNLVVIITDLVGSLLSLS